MRGVAHVNRAALETERSRDGEAKFPSSERRPRWPERTSGEMAWATPRRFTNDTEQDLSPGFRRGLPVVRSAKPAGAMDGKPVRHQFCCPDFATLLSIFVLPLPLGEGRGEGAFVESSAAEGTLTRPTAGLSQRERQDRQLSFGGAHTVPNAIAIGAHAVPNAIAMDGPDTTNRRHRAGCEDRRLGETSAFTAAGQGGGGHGWPRRRKTKTPETDAPPRPCRPTSRRRSACPAWR